MRRGAVVALAVVFAVNVAVLGSVWRNRTGPADADVWLDERELEVVRKDAREDSSVRFRLRLVTGEAWGEAGYVERYWLEPSTLAQLGFDVSVAPGDPRAERHYATQLPRQAFVVLTVGGSAWDGFLQQERQRVDEYLRDPAVAESSRREYVGFVERAERSASRLMPVDAGPDAEALRVRYPDRASVLILPATARIWLDDRKARGGGPAIRGGVELVTREILATRDQRDLLSRLAPPRAPTDSTPLADPYRNTWGVPWLSLPPRFAARIRVGALGQPWVEEVRPGR